MQAVVPKMSLRISSAALGAAWVAEAIADILGKAVEARSGFNFNLALDTLCSPVTPQPAALGR